MRSSELDYELPQELIAQHPAQRRDGSRLLVHDRASGETRHRRFDELPSELPEGTLVVVNDTRVLPARLRLERPGGGEAEVLLLERLGENGTWEALARPSRKLRPGQKLGPVELLEPLGEGRWRLRLEGEPAGEAPLPPYIRELADPSATRPSTPAARARPRRRPPGCISRRSCSQASTSSGSRCTSGSTPSARSRPRPWRSTSCTASATRSSPPPGSGSRPPSECSRSGRRPCACWSRSPAAQR
jgi:hypothetical protein